MRVLVACEFSGIVRDAFRARGHDAWSCDLLPSEGKTLGQWYPKLYPKWHPLHHHQFHHQRDVRDLFEGRVAHSMALEGQRPTWDLLIAHPPCTHLAVSGARWFAGKTKEQEEALEFVRWLLALPVPRIALENPISVISSHIRKPDQIVQPHWFGHPEFKRTCLWLKNLPPLVMTRPLKVPLRGTPEWTSWNKVHWAPPGPDRWKERSRTYTGVADAMAKQWGNLSLEVAA